MTDDPTNIITATELGLNFKITIETLWYLLAGFLVFFMHAGFSMLEIGLCRQKNSINILSKNVVVFAIASISYWMFGWGFMFGEGSQLIGYSDFFLSSEPDSQDVSLMGQFFFQLVFAATAATIVSGAVAERIKLSSFFIFSFALVTFIYPVTGHWLWGGGWLAEIGFIDFAGSTIVHSVGGWAALVSAIFLGPRLGKYLPDGKMKAIPGHNQSLAVLGMFILWLGWFGFNGGSILATDPHAIAMVVVTTNMAAAAGVIGATVATCLYLGKPDLSMAINGALGG